MIRLSIIVATEGKRVSLRRTLASASSQLGEMDQIYVVGPREPALMLEFPRVKYVDAKPGGDWGNRERELGMLYATGSHVMFIDDDDAYLPGALSVVREALARRPGNCHMFRMIDLNGLVLWRRPELVVGNVGTPMFVVPNVQTLLGSWTSRYEGDFDFMKSTLHRYDSPQYLGVMTLVWDTHVIVGCRAFGDVHPPIKK